MQDKTTRILRSRYWPLLAISLSAPFLSIKAKDTVKGGGFSFTLPEEAPKAEEPLDGLSYGELPDQAPAMEDATEGQEAVPGVVAETTDTVAESETAEPTRAFDPETTGSVIGQILDKNNGLFVEGVYVVLEPEPAESTEVLEEGETQTFFGRTDEKGAYLIEGVDPGVYTMSLVKRGYYEATVEGVTIEVQALGRFDLGLVPRDEMSDDVYELNDFVVTADDVLAGRAELIEIRAASVGQVDFLSSEDFAKFGGSNIADLVSRLAGVNVVEGQFAVVRGLGDRYNSTLLNDLPVPSPDPIRQGVQLDLFPTSIIESVVADKAFLPGLPSNSSGAAFNLITRSYPEDFTAWLETGFSVNENAKETLLVNPNAEPALGSPGGSHFDVRSILGTRDDSLRDSSKAASSTNVGSDFFDFGGQSFKFGLGDSHEDPFGGIVSRIGYVGSISYSSSSETAIGSQRDQYARVNTRSRIIRLPGRLPIIVPGTSGTLLTGDLPVSGLEYDLVNGKVKETTGFLFGTGVELDDDGDHKLNFTFLRSQSIISEAVRRDNGVLPDGISGQSNDRGFGSTGNNQLNLAADIVGRGGFDAFSQGQDILTLETRTLNARQVSGEHKFTVLGKDAEFSWGLTESDASSEIGNPSENGFVAGQSTLLYMQNVSGETLLAGPSGQLTEADLTEDIEPGAILFGGSTATAEGYAEDVIRNTARSIDDEMLGKRIDGSVDLFDFVTAKGGFFMSETTRVAQQTDELLVLPSGDIVSNSDGLNAFAVEANDVANVIPLISSADVARDIEDYYFQFDVDPIENLEVSLGARQSSVNLTASGSGQLFPAIGLFGAPSFLDSGIAGNQDITNGELIGYTEPGEGNIDEEYLLPAVSIKYSFWDNWTFRASYGKTIALPSSRELSPIFTLDTFSGDRVFGNPNLEVSEVKNASFRLERTFSDGVTSVAVSFFDKKIENPIEQIGLVDVSTGTPVQSFFNNENEASVQGFEIEGRLGLGLAATKFDDWFNVEIGFLDYFSIGGNIALIDASVGFPGPVATTYFNENNNSGPYTNANGVTEIPEDRRLFDQPEYTVNADVTFEHPDWGTRVTLSLYEQSDVLTSVGSGSNLTADQYTLPYEQFDLTFAQEFGDGWEFEFQVENITDTERGIEYDSEQVDAPPRISYKQGRTYSVALKYIF